MALQPIVNLIVPDAFFRTGKLVIRDGYEITTLDKVEIIEVVTRFDWSYLSKNIEGLADLLTDDMIFDHAMVYAEGKEKVVKIVDDFPALSYGLRHNFSNQVVFVDADGDAACLSYMTVIKIAAEEKLDVSMPFLLDHAIVQDKLRRVDGKWKLARRNFDQQKLSDSYQIPDDVRRKMEMTTEERAKAEGRT